MRVPKIDRGGGALAKASYGMSNVNFCGLHFIWIRLNCSEDRENGPHGSRQSDIDSVSDIGFALIPADNEALEE
ncbi:hypothetical protein NPIL_404861 [Nephila pilipes]|uniref:Uncharacterized protein n=1 Tax=Nephila pilipes TaxID=299642 RepID=A0A8X6UHU2_NEPPI|nr:hypothetical protein NPIL_404861 [Nephila pilipes]